MVTGRSLLARGAAYFVLLGLIVLGPWHERGSYLGPVQATATAAILEAAGVDATSSGDTVEGRGFSMQVAPVCDGLDFALILALAMLVSPVGYGARLVGIVVAAAVSQVLNLIRLVSMFAVGAHFPASFDLVHHVVWQVGSILVAAWVYVAWVERATAADAP